MSSLTIEQLEAGHRARRPKENVRKAFKIISLRLRQPEAGQ